MRLSLFSSKQCIIKQLLDSVFVISRIIKVSVSVISLSLRLRLITLTSTLTIPDITETSSNNCLLFVKVWKEAFSCHLLTFLQRLTAFVMRVFCKAQQFTAVDIDEDLVCESVRWLIENQRGDGALPEVFKVIHREMVVRKGTYKLI